VNGATNQAATFMESLFKHAVVGVGLADQEGHILLSNPALQTFLGYSAEELADLHYADITHPDDLRLSDGSRGIWTGEIDHWRQEKRYVRKDGGAVWGRVMVSRIPESLLAGPFALVMIEDITDQKRAEDARDATENFYRALFELSLHGVLLTKGDGTVLDANPAACELLGMTAEEIRARGRDGLLVPGPDVERGIRERRETGKVHAEVDFIRGDGSSFRSEITSALLPDVCAAPRAFVVFADISDRKRGEEALRESRDVLVKLAAQVPGAIYQFRLFPDGHACLPWASEAIKDVFEVTAEQVAEDATPIFDRLHPEDRDTVMNRITETARSLERFHVEYRVVLPEKGVRWHLSDAKPERTADGGALWHGIILDITERKQMEEALHESEGRLREAQKLEAIGRLAGGVAHDFNNVLTAIIGYSDFVLSDPMFKHTAWYSDVGRIRTAAERASGLTRQILAFSRRQRLQAQVVSLNDLVTEVVPLLRRTLGEDVELVASLSPETSPVEVDPAQFTQVLMNLAVNARDAMPDGGRLTFATDTVWLDERSVANDPDVAPGAYVRLAVSDTGVGIEPGAIPLLYEPFYTTKAPGQGTGLGLPTVYGIVKQSGGTIDVRSVVGKGTTFEVFLPQAKDKQPESAPDETTEEVEAAAASPAREHVLLVEDEEAVRRLTERMLENLGYVVRSVADGPDALALLEDPRTHVDLLISDVVLPGGVDGGEIARRARQMREALAVLFVSGYTRNVVLESGDPDERVQYLAKPFNAQQLAAKAREALEEARKPARDRRG
jgi:two-component system, cell cycle sensor histidine kinase and response regulator CckA